MSRISAATSVEVGRAIGAGTSYKVRTLGFLGVGLGVGVMLTSSSVMWLFPAGLARILTEDANVALLSVGLIRVAAVFQVVDGIQAVAAGALRGAGVTRWTFMAQLVSHWGIGLPLGAFLAFILEMGPYGLWWGLTAGLAVVSVALVLKFMSISGRELLALQNV
ncbi:MAG: MATE family efflux transporter [Myxococcota bacterium]